MRMRMKSRWRDKQRPRSLEDNAIALAINAWRIALTCAKHLHEEGFRYESDEQRIAVIAEYLIFLVHWADRLALARMDAQERERFTTTLVRQVARHIRENEEMMGLEPLPFFERLNERTEDYAEIPFEEASAGYSALRYLAGKIQAIMGEDQVNRWVADQIIDIDAPEAAQNLKQAMDGLFGTTPHHGMMGVNLDD